jgi:hypothetical protein
MISVKCGYKQYRKLFDCLKIGVGVEQLTTLLKRYNNQGNSLATDAKDKN